MVRILVDSGADYEPQELAAKNILCAPMSIQFGETSYLDGVTLSKSEFYSLLETQFPTTSQPTPFEFAKHFQEAKEAGDEMVVITISSALSGTYQGACIAREDVDYDGIYIFDSKSATIGTQVLVDYAIRLRDDGKSAKEIYDAVAALRPRIRLFASINTLEYLYKGGRLSKAAANIGTVAHLKPMITVDDGGGIAVIGKSIGMKRSIDSLAAKISQYELHPDFPLYPVYSRDPENLDLLVERLRKLGVEIDGAGIRNLGPTVGAHVGPSCCGLAFVVKE